jgi:hypothetical protein
MTKGITPADDAFWTDDPTFAPFKAGVRLASLVRACAGHTTILAEFRSANRYVAEEMQLAELVRHAEDCRSRLKPRLWTRFLLAHGIKYALLHQLLQKAQPLAAPAEPDEVEDDDGLPPPGVPCDVEEPVDDDIDTELALRLKWEHECPLVDVVVEITAYPSGAREEVEKWPDGRIVRRRIPAPPPPMDPLTEAALAEARRRHREAKQARMDELRGAPGA